MTMHHASPSQSILIRFLLLALALSPLSCAVYDPGYQTLLPSAETSPDRDAIVGMWHRKYDDGMGTNLRMSLLLRQDGTGLVDSVQNDWLMGQRTLTDEIGTFTWKYDGGGVWSLSDAKGRVDQCRIAQGNLLRFYNARKAAGPEANSGGYFVYERISQ